MEKRTTHFLSILTVGLIIIVSQGVKANTQVEAATVTSATNKAIVKANYSIPKITKEWHTFSMFNYSTANKKPNGIVFHQTANYGAYTARGEADYEINGGWRSAFVHTFVDASTILNIHDTDYGSWGAGPKANARFVQFELVTARNQTEFQKSINNAAWYTAYLASEYELKLSLASAGSSSGVLWSHSAVSQILGGTNHTDPIGYLKSGYTSPSGKAVKWTWPYDMSQFLELAKYYYAQIELTRNSGSFDNIHVNDNTLFATGWHATAFSVNKPYSFIVILDADNKKVLAKYAIKRIARPDVGKVYPDIPNSGMSGFNFQIELSSAFTGHKIQVVSRYSSDKNGETNYTDLVSSKIVDLAQSRSYLESISLTNTNQVKISGWFAASGSVGRPYRSVIVYDEDLGKEIKRVPLTTVSRPDVGLAFPTIAGSSQSGFTATLPIPVATLANKNIKFYLRYSTLENGGGSYVQDETKTYRVGGNYGAIESIQQTSSLLNIRGWNISSNSYGKKYRFIFLMDSKNNEIARYPIDTSMRKDVGSAYPLVYGSQNSGFSIAIPLQSNIRGKVYTLKLRYSSDSNGNGSYTDTDFKATHQITELENQNKGSLDSAVMSGNSINISGWHAADRSDIQPYRFLFLLDANSGKEVYRSKINSVSRPDVGKAHPNIFNSGNSGFMVKIPITSLVTNRNLKLLLRYSSDINGNTGYTNLFFSKILYFKR